MSIILSFELYKALFRKRWFIHDKMSHSYKENIGFYLTLLGRGESQRIDNLML